MDERQRLALTAAGTSPASLITRAPERRTRERIFHSFSPATDERYRDMRNQALRYAPVNVMARRLELPDVLRFDAGDVMKCIGTAPFMNAMSRKIIESVELAQRDPTFREYVPKLLYDEVRAAIAQRFRVDEFGYVMPVNGISDGMDIFIRVFSRWYSSGTGSPGRFLTFIPTYPSWLAAIICHDDINFIDAVARESSGQPSLSAFKAKLNEKTMVVFILPEENPLSISIKREAYRNKDGTGIFDQIDKMIDKTGRPIVVALDVIYNSMAWGPNRLSIDELIELLGDKIIGVFFDSASKIYGQAGLRAGAIALRVPKDEELRRITRTLVADMELEEAHILGIGYPAMFGLKHLHSKDPEIERERRAAVEIFASRVPQNFRIIKDMNSQELALPLADAEPDCAFYGLYRLADSYPWNDNRYKRKIWERAVSLATATENLELIMMLQDMERMTPPELLPASEIFASDAYLNAGVQLIPGNRCYPATRKIQEPLANSVLFRMILGYPEEETKEASSRLGGMIERSKRL